MIEPTLDQDAISKRVHRPNIRGPVRMAQPSGEGEEPVLQLKQLTPRGERSESQGKHANDAHAELDDIEETRAENRLRVQTVDPQQVDEVCQGEV